MKFGKLISKDEYSAVAKLIYQTDAYLYPDLFGSIENAKKLLPYLLEDKRSHWYKDYIYVAKENGSVIGIITVIPFNVDWNYASVQMAYMECGLELDDRVKAVCEYFAKASENIGIGASACNICIREDYRGNGIGSFMLEKVIEMVGHNNIELSVLADNTAAIHLYEKYGFVTVRQFYDYGGYGNPPILCNFMVRLGVGSPSKDE